MKKLLYIALYLSVTIPLLSACKEDEKNTEADKPSIVGIWGITQFDVEISIGGISLADFLVDSLDFSSPEVAIAEALIQSEVKSLFENEAITFKNDQTYEVLVDSNLQIGTWDLNADQTVLTISPIEGQQIALEVTSLSDEVLRFLLNELVQADDFLDTSAFGITLTEGLQVEASFTLIKQN
ncbi:MAG: hypothetical protein ACJAT1_000987 [Marivirga sp.]|jgi:hypothetical protein